MEKKGRSRKTFWQILVVSLFTMAAASFILLFLYRKDDRVWHVLQRESYAATEDFARLFCEDVEKAVRYANLRQHLETDGELDLDAEIYELELSDNVVEGITLAAAIQYGEQLGLYFDENNRLVTRREGSGKEEPVILENTEAVAEDGGLGDIEARSGETFMAAGDEEEASDGNYQQEYFYYPSDEELLQWEDDQVQERLVLLDFLYALADYYDLQKYLCVNEGQTNFAYRFVYADAERTIRVDQNLENPGNSEDVIGLGAYFRMDSSGENLNYNFHDGMVQEIFSVMAQGGLLDGGTYELAAGVNIEFPCHDQYFDGLKSYRKLQLGIVGVLLALGMAALLSFYASVRLFMTSGEAKGVMDRWYTEPAAAIFLLVVSLFVWAAVITRDRAVAYPADALLLVCFCTLILLYLYVVLNICGLVRRYRSHSFFSRSLCVILGRELKTGLREALKNGSRLLWGLLGYLFINLLLGVLLGRSYVEWWGYGNQNSGWQLLFYLSLLGFLALNLLFLLGAVRQIRSSRKITESLTSIAEGDLETKLAEDGFRGPELIQVRAINAIGEGLAKAVEEKTKSERMKTDLIANVSHDLRTPLTSIINYVELIRREKPENPKIQGYVEVLEKKAMRLKHLTEDLLDASKVSSGNMPVSWMRIDLVQMVSQMEGEFQEKLDAAGLTVVMQSVDPPLYIQADGRLLFRVLENLYNNVCKYAMPGTRVYIDIKETSHKAVFTIKNISAAPLNITAEELSERFVRGDSSRTTEGSGLGLSIAQSITELLHGQFEIYLEGDLFRVRLIFPLDETETSSI